MNTYLIAVATSQDIAAQRRHATYELHRRQPASIQRTALSFRFAAGLRALRPTRTGRPIAPAPRPAAI